MYVYRFINIQQQIVYIGRTNNLKRRLTREHFTERGHLGETCYRETQNVEYARVASVNESKMYEMYLIEKYQPKYNEQGVSGGAIGIPMPELQWKTYKINKNSENTGVSKGKVIKYVKDYTQKLEDEVEYMGNYLRGKDQVGWLSKLTEEERNEYLSMVYGMERYVRGIDELKDKLLEKTQGGR